MVIKLHGSANLSQNMMVHLDFLLISRYCKIEINQSLFAECNENITLDRSG